MGLVRLLSASKALCVAADLPHRYRTARPGKLPKFEPPSQEANCGMPMKTEISSRPAETGEPKPAAAAASAARVDPGSAPGQPSVRPSGARWAGALSGLRTLFSLRRGGQAQRPSAAAAIGTLPEPVQQELRLDNVRVCRNDLADADWEVVEPPKSGARLAFLRKLAGSKTAPGGRSQAGARAAATPRI
jgi:hypothetical protein